MGIFSRNPVGDFNTQGMAKCPRCGDYYPKGWGDHGSECTKPPEEDEDDE